MKTNNYVPALRRVEMPAMPIDAEIRHTIDVAPTATQHIEVKTSAVDRAKGFLLASIPLYAAFATAVVALCVLGFGLPWLSLLMLIVFLLAFVAVWFLGYTYTLQVSAEGVSLYEATEKWDVIKLEQRKRWEQWEKQIEEVDDAE